MCFSKRCGKLDYPSLGFDISRILPDLADIASLVHFRHHGVVLPYNLNGIRLLGSSSYRFDLGQQCRMVMLHKMNHTFQN